MDIKSRRIVNQSIDLKHSPWYKFKMKTKQIPERFKQEAERLGGRFVVVSKKSYQFITEKNISRGWDRKSKPNIWYQCPFNDGIAINYDRKIVMYSPEMEPLHPGHLCHEMGHVFATKKKPNRADEYSFLAWEMLLAKRLRVFTQWVQDQEEYSLDQRYGINNEMVDDIGDADRLGLLKEVYKDAKNHAENNIRAKLPVAIR